MVSPKVDNRDLELARSPSQGSLSGAPLGAAPLASEEDILCGSSSSEALSPPAEAAAAASQQLHELLEEPVDEMVSVYKSYRPCIFIA